MTSTLLITFWLTVILFGVPASIRTFRREMRDDNKVRLFVGCIGIIVFCVATKALTQ